MFYTEILEKNKDVNRLSRIEANLWLARFHSCFWPEDTEPVKL